MDRSRWGVVFACAVLSCACRRTAGAPSERASTSSVTASPVVKGGKLASPGSFRELPQACKRSLHDACPAAGCQRYEEVQPHVAARRGRERRCGEYRMLIEVGRDSSETRVFSASGELVALRRHVAGRGGPCGGDTHYGIDVHCDDVSP